MYIYIYIYIYSITFLPLSFSCTSEVPSHLGSSWLLRTFGSMNSAPPGGGWKCPDAAALG